MTQEHKNVESDASVECNSGIVDSSTLREKRTVGQIPSEYDGLGPWGEGRFYIAGLPYGDGRDARLVDFQPTRDELRTLAYDYLDRHFVEQLCGAMGYGGSLEWRRCEFTWRRFYSIEEALNPDKRGEEFRAYIAHRWAEVDELSRKYNH